MPVSLRSYVRVPRIRLHAIRRIARSILLELGEASSELGLAFVGDRRIHRLNKEFRGKDYATDVLAFPMGFPDSPLTEFPVRQLGDVVISLPTAMRQARLGSRSIDEEITALMVHGILHLCGYDHETAEREARRMRRREHMVLRRLAPIPRLCIGTKK
ncbi:putative rRNA maturation factor [Nitrospira sp. KM1]|uniref:rRNA maturation RNase YbeY n=1 Tax=Nitrospira sp. KM1 TaxID=1936990 RepID=UPI0013A7A646|nr:rRNA maturation RNase YbeY [Nitrospira sp. KM1]BCA54968.1 putative rRNA maturation factor [Nitrospira sp. KM1]